MSDLNHRYISTPFQKTYTVLYQIIWLNAIRS